MPTFKNLYKMPVNIYFGDLEPTTVFYYDEVHQHLWVGREDHGCFSKKQYEEVKASWKSWCESHHFDADLGRWVEKTA